MEEKIVTIINEMADYLNISQMKKLQEVLLQTFSENTIQKEEIPNEKYLQLFLDAKRIEGCSGRTIQYYSVTVDRMFQKIENPVRKISTEEIRKYLVDYQKINNCSKYMLEDGNLLISLTGNVGRVAILEKEFLPAALNQRVACLRLKTSRLTKGYLFHILNDNLFEQQCIQSSKGVAQKNMSTEWLKNYEILLYSKEKQDVITEILDKTYNVISCRQQELQKLDDLIRTRFVELFGDSEHNTKRWSIAKLSSLCNVGSSKRIYQSELTETGIPFLRISDLNEKIDGKNNTPQLFIPNGKYDELQTKGLVPSVGDILVTARGTLGRCYIIKPSDTFYFQAGMISWLSDINESITSLYLSYLFSTTGVQKQIANLQAGSTVAYLSIAMLKNLDIMIPPKTLQKQFAYFVNQVNKSKFSKEDKISSHNYSRVFVTRRRFL